MQDTGFVLPFMQEGTALVLIIAGLLGFLYASERVLKFVPFISVNTEDQQTKFLMGLSAILAILTTVWVLLMWIEDSVNFHWLTVVLLVMFTVFVLSQPLKEVEGWQIFLLLIPLALISIVGFWFANERQLTLFGLNIPLWLPLVLITVVMGIIFILIFTLEETTIDPILSVLGWAPFVVIIGILMIIQGVLLLINFGDVGYNGLGNFLGLRFQLII